jgi:bacteriocin biosynthesis cyclodehydratase domain-containing protein
MLNTPVFKGNLRVDVLPGEGVLLLSEEGSAALFGAAYEKIVPLIDGHRSVDEIVDALAGQVDPARVYYVLNRLEAKGYLCEPTPDIASGVAAFWQSMGIGAEAVQEALSTKSVAVVSIGNVDSAPMIHALEAIGAKIGATDKADLLLVVTDDYLRTELAQINEAALASKRPWMLVRLTGRELWLGPLFRPGETGCWICLRDRLFRNRAIHRFIWEKKSLDTPPCTAVGTLGAAQMAACQMAAIATAQFLTAGTNGLSGKVLSLDLAMFTSQTHALLRHPHCTACGTEEKPTLEPVQLQPGRAKFARDGGHRQISPEATLKKYEHLVSPITGVVRVLMSMRQDEGIAHVYMADQNSAFRMDRLNWLKRGLRSASCGKGMSDLQAKVSALCEAIERYSGEFTGRELRVTCALEDWPDGDAYHPNDIMRFSDQQYAEREKWNRRLSRFNIVPEPFDTKKRIDWAPVWSLTEQRHKYLPTQLVYYRCTATEGDGTHYAIGCSNGAAAGNTIEEAVLQGFFELVERDCVALWWYNRLKKPGVAVETFGEPYLLELIEYYRAQQRECWALDITSDLGIPTFAAFSRLVQGPQEQILFGLGCHFEPRIALHRAFAEMNQMLGVAGDDGKLRVEDDETLFWLLNATTENQPYVVPDATVPPTRCSDFANNHSDDLLVNIERCRKIVEERGMEMLVLNQTRSDVNLPVVKVVVPGLRHFWARFAPGRLYDVPVRQGWLPRPLTEDELNPIPMFF